MAGIIKIRPVRLLAILVAITGLVILATRREVGEFKQPIEMIRQTYFETPKSRANATLYTFIPDVEQPDALLRTVRSVETSYNCQYRYDWVFSFYDLEDTGFPEELLARLEMMVSGRVIIETINSKNPYFQFPEGIDYKHLREKSMANTYVGLSPNKRFIEFKLKDRFATYGFQFLPSLAHKRYVLNIEVGLVLQCDIMRDIIKEMEDQNMLWGFSYTPVESPLNFQTMWKKFSAYKAENQYEVVSDNLWDFIADGNVKFTRCSLETNLAVLNLDALRSDKFKRFFLYMDAQYGQFYERWTDANLFTLYFSTFESKDSIDWLGQTGYLDWVDRSNCPRSLEQRTDRACFCDPLLDTSFTRYSCLRHYFEVQGDPLPDGEAEMKDYKMKVKRLKVRNRPFEAAYKRQQERYNEVFKLEEKYKQAIKQQAIDNAA